MTNLSRAAAALLTFLLAAPAAFAGPVSGATSHPKEPPSGWNTTNVDVLITIRSPTKGPTSITFSVSGAQQTKSTTVQGSSASVPVRAEGESTVTFVARDGSGNGGTNKHKVHIDRTPPTTSVTHALMPDGSRLATITAQDALSGVKEVRFNLGGFGPDQVVPGDSATVVLPAGQWSNLFFWAIDNAGNEQYPYNTLSVGQGITTNPLQVELTAPVGGIGTANMTIVQTGLIAADVLSITSDSGYFWPSGGACVFPMTGVVGCALQVFFYAPGPFDYFATLYIQTNNSHEPFHAVPLHGRGMVPGIEITPNPVAFLTTQVGSASPPVTVRLKNNTGAHFDVTRLATTDAQVFSIVANRCPVPPFTFTAGGACEVDVAFEPTGYGMHPGALEVQMSPGGAVAFAPFEAFGSVPTQLRAVPPSLNFGLVPVGSNEKQVLEIYNDGPVPYFVESLSLIGVPMYQITEAQCTNGAPPTSLEPSQVCRLTIVYVPTSPGVHGNLLRMESSLGQPAFSVQVTGQAN